MTDRRRCGPEAAAIRRKETSLRASAQASVSPVGPGADDQDRQHVPLHLRALRPGVRASLLIRSFVFHLKD